MDISMDISMDIHGKSVDMDMDMDGKFHIHGKPGLNALHFKRVYKACHLLFRHTVRLHHWPLSLRLHSATAATVSGQEE